MKCVRVGREVRRFRVYLGLILNTDIDMVLLIRGVKRIYCGGVRDRVVVI